MTKEKIRIGLRWRLTNLIYKLHPEPLLSWVYYATKKSIKLYKKEKFDVIITSGPPHITHIVGLVLKCICGVKWVADFRDPWTEGEACYNQGEIGWRWRRLGEKIEYFKKNMINEF